MKRTYNFIFNICSKCNMRCRHCSNEETLRDATAVPPSTMLDWLQQVKDSGVSSVTFVGGEPFLLLEDLRLYCQKATELGLTVTIITNGYWARTKEKALEVLQSLPGLSSILLSSDLYHLEFIDSSLIKHALDACLELQINVALNVTCASKEEKNRVGEIYKEYKNRVFIHSHMMMPIGAAKKLPIERWRFADKAHSLPVICGIGNFLVEQNGEVHACCNAILPEESLLYVGNMHTHALPDLLTGFEQDQLFNFIKKSGPRGIAKIFMESPYYEEFKDRQYTCECDLCIDLLGSEERQKYLLEQIEGLEGCPK